MLFDLTIIGFGVIGVETLHGIKEKLSKIKNKKKIKIAVIEKKINNIPGGVAYSKENSKFGFFNNPLRLSHPEFIEWFNINTNKKKIFQFADNNISYNLSEWSNKNKYILNKNYKDYNEIYLPRLIYSIYLKEKIINFLKQVKKINVEVSFFKGKVDKIHLKKFYEIISKNFFKKFSINVSGKKNLIKKYSNKKLKLLITRKIIIGIGIIPPKKINEKKK